METLVAFSLGMVSVAVIIAVGVMVRLWRTTDVMSRNLQDQELSLMEQDRRLDETVGELHRRIDNEVQELQRQLDSRLDKLESKLSSKTVLKG